MQVLSGERGVFQERRSRGRRFDFRFMGNRLKKFVSIFDRNCPEDGFELPFKFKLRVPNEILP